MVPGEGTKVLGIYMGRVGEERGGEETDRCPLTHIFPCNPQARHAS
jgi:hypothetical protein